MENMDKVWKAYCASRSPALKEKLILEYAPLVKYVAGRLVLNIGQHVEYDDLISYGIFGLIDAIDKFDPEKGVKFETYASLRIKGSIIDSIRKLDWVPRTLRQRNKQFEQTYTQLEEQLGREPTDQELAGKLSLSIEEVHEFIKKSLVLSVISLDDYLDQNYESAFPGNLTAPVETPETHMDKQELHTTLTDAISKLSDKEKQVVTLYYFEELTLKEISLIMGVSESRISQIHSKAMMRLQAKLGRHKALLFS
ncbi:MAG: FliA/WhiG family RNA polymerase sigma factor [Clostridiales bacterium]|jgi:RNA polymerase sigma factor for flagellar operon FliA|nr:FliA/WhiG family RNA polymerase sigma factor [Clostridiales bacterium]